MEIRTIIGLWALLGLMACASPKRSVVSAKRISLYFPEQPSAVQLVSRLKFLDFPEDFAVELVKDFLWLESWEHKKKQIGFSQQIAKILHTKEQQLFSSFLLKHVRALDYSPYHCQGREVSCTYPQTPGVVFINNRFFQLNRPARMATLMHETFHFFSPTRHSPCRGKKLGQLECDSKLFSPYGVEVLFLQQAILNCDEFYSLEGQMIQRELDAAVRRIESI